MNLNSFSDSRIATEIKDPEKKSLPFARNISQISKKIGTYPKSDKDLDIKQDEIIDHQSLSTDLRATDTDERRSNNLSVPNRALRITITQPIEENKTNNQTRRVNNCSTGLLLPLSFIIILNIAGIFTDIYQNGLINFQKEQECPMLILQILINCFLIICDMILIRSVFIIDTAVLNEEKYKMKLLLICQILFRNSIILLLVFFNQSLVTCYNISQKLGIIWIIYMMNLFYDVFMLCVQNIICFV